MKNVFHSENVGQTEQIAAQLAKKLHGGEVIAYFGGLGMGKTAFTRGLAAGLGLNADVTSPTFTLVNEYEGEIPLYHFDMYRISSFEDLISTGYYDYLDTCGILAVEWSENIEDYLPQDAVKIYFERGKTENERTITIEGCSDEYTFD